MQGGYSGLRSPSQTAAVSNAEAPGRLLAMKVFVFAVALAFFVGSFFLFGYAFSVPEAWAGTLFFGGILSVCVSLAIPFHLLPRTD